MNVEIKHVELQQVIVDYLKRKLELSTDKNNVRFVHREYDEQLRTELSTTITNLTAKVEL